MKDLRGFNIREGDEILINNFQMKVIEVHDSIVLGGTMRGPQTIPGKIVCHVEFPVQDISKPVNCVVLAREENKSNPSDGKGMASA